MAVSDYEPVIGLEVHAQLLTKSKLFCPCATSFGGEPNTQVCPTCLGLPGALPALNRAAVEMAVKAGKALGCEVQERSVWSRKNYFYPDSPKGYQISQYELPICKGGFVPVLEHDGSVREVALERIHLEEDAGKSVHADDGSEVDLNRSSVPLIEIVGKPDLRSADEASEYLKSLRLVLLYLGINDGNLEEGSFRCDANVSIRKRGAEKLGTRVELKNINSFRFIRQAIDLEIARQAQLLDAGSPVRMETRLFDHEKNETRAMRSKEEANDYRYFPEPDLPPLQLTAAFVQGVRVPPLPHERYAALLAAGVSQADARTIVNDVRLVALHAKVTAIAGAESGKRVAHLIVGDVLRLINDGRLDLESPKFTPDQIIEVFKLQDAGAISSTAAREVLAEVLASGAPPAQVVQDKGLAQVSDTSALEAVVDAILARSPGEVDKYRAGKKSLLGFFVGAAMKELKGKGNPGLLNALMRKRLGD